MADVNIDPKISLGLTPPNAMQNLGNLVQTAAGIQEFQKARELLPYAIEAGKAQSELAKLQSEKAGYETARAKQENFEREAKQTFFSNPDNWQTNGRIDINKVNKSLPAIAPLTHREDLDRLTALGQAQTKGIEAQANMTTGFRTIIGNTLGILGRAGVKDAATYSSALTDLKDQYKDNKDVVNFIDSRLEILKHVPKGADVSKEALRESLSLLSPAEQEAAFAPRVSTVNTGMNIQPVVTTPSVMGSKPSVETTGKPIPLSIAPGQQATVEQDRAGNFMIITRNQDGTVASSVPLPVGQAPQQPTGQQPAGRQPAQPAGQQPAQQSTYSTDMPALRFPVRPEGGIITNMSPQEKVSQDSNIKYRTTLVDSQKDLGSSRDNLNHVMETAGGLQANSWFTSGALGSLSRRFKTFAGDPTYIQLSKDLANVALTNMQVLGNGSAMTDSGRNMVNMANGTETYPPKVLIDIARRTYADLTNIDLQASGADAFARKYGEANLDSFKKAWGANADRKVFQMIDMSNAIDQMPAGKEKEKAELELNALIGSGEKAKILQKKYNNIMKLSKTGEL